MIRTTLSNTLRLAADALDTHPAPWEAELDALRQQVGDLDAAVADGLGGRAKSIDALACRLIETMCASSLQDAVEIAEGYKRDAAAADKEVYRLNATNATLRKDLCEHMAKAYRPYYADRNKMHAALFGAGVKGGPGAWRWHSDPQGTTFSDVAAFCRLMLERLDIGDAPEEATDCADLTTRLDAARDGLKAARTCLARLGEARVVDALLAVERGLARSAPDVVREAVAEAARAADLATPAELDAVRKELCATRSSLTHVLDCVSEARMQLDRDEVSKALNALDAVENGLAKAAPDLAATPEPINKAAELRAAGWRHKPHRGWTFGAYSVGYIANTEDAYRAMVEDREREKARAATARDTLTDPRPGDLFVDEDGCTWFCIGPRAYVLRNDEAPFISKNCGIRPATPEEVAKFRKDHNL